MTYLTFHLWFNLPVLLVLLAIARNRLKPGHWMAIGATAAIALLAATPWDNWAVYRGIWGFDWTRATAVTIPVGGIEWKLPAEEYAFFAVESLMVGIVASLFLGQPREDRR